MVKTQIDELYNEAIQFIYRSDYSLKGIRAMPIDIAFNCIPCIEGHHVKDLLVFLRIIGTSVASNILDVFPHIFLIHVSRSIEHWKYQPDAKHKLQV